MMNEKAAARRRQLRAQGGTRRSFELDGLSEWRLSDCKQLAAQLTALEPSAAVLFRYALELLHNELGAAVELFEAGGRTRAKEIKADLMRAAKTRPSPDEPAPEPISREELARRIERAMSRPFLGEVQESCK